MSTLVPATPSHPIGFGAAYYFEYQQTDRLDEDLDLMVDAAFTVIRVGESVWSTWEPSDGEFDLEWLAPVLDGAHRRGIDVILGTPTYAIPPWLQTKHPDLAAESPTGRRVPWGGRQEVDYSQPLFRTYAERVIRRILGRYADHPAVVGFQVDNEPGMLAFHNPGAFEEFRSRLQARYGSVDDLNREWGLTYWSHRLSDWAELWTPDGNTLPQYDLAWRSFQADLTTEYIAWQAGLVREYSRPSQFVTTCIAYPRPSLHDEQLSRSLDVSAANPYYGMQDHLDLQKSSTAPAPWTTSGVAGLFRQADRAWSSKQARFLVTETNAQSIGLSDLNQPGYPGQLQLAGLALVSRGASLIEYWHWHTLHFGTETYWGGVLPHSQKPGRTYREVAALGRVLSAIGPATRSGYEPDADVALIYSSESKWAFEFTPPIRTEAGDPDRAAYELIFDAFHAGIIGSGAQARIYHPDQLGTDAAAFARRHPVLVAAAFYITTDEQLQFLDAYVNAGGHLIMGPRTGYADEEARARREVAPPRLADTSGTWYEEYSNIDAPITVTSHGSFPALTDAHGRAWVDGLVSEDSEILATYDHPGFERFPAVTTREVRAGRVTLVGTIPDAHFSEALIRWAVPHPVAGAWSGSAAVRLASGVTPEGQRLWFISNWSATAGWADAPTDLTDPITGTRVGTSHIELAPWGSRVLIENIPDSPTRPASTEERDH